MDQDFNQTGPSDDAGATAVPPSDTDMPSNDDTPAANETPQPQDTAGVDTVSETPAQDSNSSDSAGVSPAPEDSTDKPAA